MAKTITSFFGKKKREEPFRLSNASKKKAKLEGVSKDVYCNEVEDLVQHLYNPGASSGISWFNSLSKHFHTSSFNALAKFLSKERARNPNTIFPPANETFASLNLTPLDKVKVVIIGQDPYHGPGQGHGLAFSVKRGVQKPPSLRNIFKEVYGTSDNSKLPKHGHLESWAKQGVLLLNTVLTVKSGQANSHKNRGWERFTDEVVNVLNRESNGLVFLLWGRPSQEKGKCINRSKHVVISTSHPSPLGATKTKSPFIGSNCFQRANDELLKRGKESINWMLPP